MRNPFDQYSQPENRLTHALASSLARDKNLLRNFIKWTTGRNFSKKEALHVIEQSLPDQIEESEEEAVRRGLPDACIYTDSGWVLVIESKVTSKVSVDQLDRHIATLKKRGFSDIRLLVITTEKNEANLPGNALIRTWSEIYEWGHGYGGTSIWAKLFTEYFEIAEAKMIKENQLKEGTLTRFTGIHFDNDNPYSYHEAKRLLKLLIAELKMDTRFLRDMGIDPRSTGRGAITGSKSTAVWDYLGIREMTGNEPFTSYPHVTIGIHQTETEISITMPDKVKREVFNAIFKLDDDSFGDLMKTVLGNLTVVLKKDPAARPFIRVLQRHYSSQKGPSFKDAELEFDMRTAFQAGKGGMVKYQRQWIDVALDAMRNKKSNMQFQAGVTFSYDRCAGIKGAGAVTLIKESIFALKPFLERALGR